MSTSALAPTDTVVDTVAQSQQQAESISTCRYPSKKCWNARARKRNGEMHNLCDLHREKANKNQRRLEQKRKTSKKVAANAKRARKSRAAAKHKVARTAVRATKQVASRQPTRKRSTPTVATVPTATTMSTTTSTTRPPMLMPVPMPMPIPTSVCQSTATTLPSGFFTDLMMADAVFAKQPATTWPILIAPPQQPSHVYQHQRYVKAPSVVNVDDLLDHDLDALADCLDSIPPTTSSSLLGIVGGNSSPIDVCDGLDAVAAVSDFWWHPMGLNGVVDPALDVVSGLGDELFALPHC